MGGRGRLVAGVVAVAVAGGLAWWWLRDGSGPSGDQAGAGTSSSSRGATRMNAQAGRGPLRWLGQLGLAPRRIAGRVTHAGAPVAGATVRLELGGVLRWAVPPVEVTSRDDGTFDFGPQAAAEFLVVANARGRAPAGAKVDLRDPTMTPPPERIELALAACAQTVFGLVHDHGGPIAAASVRAAADRASFAITTTGADGNYELCLAQDGGRMAVEADGYARAEVELGGGKKEHRDVELSPEAVVTGLVVGPDDQPVAGALVTARRSEMSRFNQGDVAGVSDGTGRFAIGGLSPGRYALSARDTGRATADEVEAVAQVGESEEVTLRLSPTVVLRGRVLEDGRPVAGVALSIRNDRLMLFGRSLFASTDVVSQSDGAFVLDGVAAGPFTIDVRGYELLEPTEPTATLPDTEIVVKVASKARILGRVTREGKPVPHARVSVRGSGRSFGGSAETRPDGSYEVAGLDPGTFEIGAQSEDAFARHRAISVARGQRLEGVNIELDLAGEASGVVVDQRGHPVGGVAVSFEMGPGIDWGFATTDADGTFVARAMSGGGDYAVTVRPSRNSSIQFQPAPGTSFPTVSLTDGRSRATGVRIAIQVDRKQISGVVTQTGGKPAADVKVSAFPPLKSSFEARYTQPVAEVITGDDGTFVLRDLLAGDYTVRASTGAGLEATENVPAGRANLRLTLPAAGSIEGALVGFGDNARVIAAPVSSLDPFRARVTGNRFAIRGIPAGSYMVSARNGARSDETMLEVPPGKTVTVTLTSKGTATVNGRVINLVTRDPVGDLECRASGGWDLVRGARTDAAGKFRLDVPAGRKVQVRCTSRNFDMRVIGSVEVEVAAGAGAEILVEAVVMKKATDFLMVDVGLFPASSTPLTIGRVTSGGPAEAAGVKVGDQLLKVDGVSVSSVGPAQAMMLMLDHRIGEKVELVLGRDGREIAVSVEVVGRKR